MVRHGLIAKSFVPPAPQRELRELLRYRRDPLGVLHIGLATRHVTDMPGVADDEVYITGMHSNKPTSACRFSHKIRPTIATDQVQPTTPLNDHLHLRLHPKEGDRDATVLKKELEDRLAAAKSARASWPDVIADLDSLSETEIGQDGKRFLLRSAPRPAAGLALSALGLALPPTLRLIGDA